MFRVYAAGNSLTVARLAMRAVVLGICLGLLSCKQDSPGTGPELPAPDQLEQAATRAGPVARVSFTGPDQVEALFPFGMLRLHPVLSKEENWLGLRHARSEDGVDFELRWQPDHVPDSASMALRGGPGWFNLGMPGQPQLEASASQRGAHYRLQSPPDSPLVLALGWLDFGQARAGQLEVARGRRSINGQFTGRGGETLHVALRFSRAFRAANRNPDGSIELVFDQRAESLELALSLSTVDINGARANLESFGVPDFADVQRQAREAWAAQLEHLGLSGDEALRGRAYLSLYRLIAAYGDMADSDGRYRAANDTIRRVAHGRPISPTWRRSSYRTVIPMLSLVAPDIMADLFETIMAHQRATGHLPHRTVWGRARGSVATNPFATVLATLASRSLPGIDAAQALPSLLRASLPGSPGLPWAEYDRLGYFSFNTVPTGSVSRSLEAASVHHATASLAAQLGERDLAESFAARVLLYRQLFDPGESLFRGRDNARDWRTPFAPLDNRGDGGPGSVDYDDADAWAALWSSSPV